MAGDRRSFALTFPPPNPPTDFLLFIIIVILFVRVYAVINFRKIIIIPFGNKAQKFLTETVKGQDAVCEVWRETQTMALIKSHKNDSLSSRFWEGL